MQEEKRDSLASAWPARPCCPPLLSPPLLLSPRSLFFSHLLLEHTPYAAPSCGLCTRCSFCVQSASHKSLRGWLADQPCYLTLQVQLRRQPWWSCPPDHSISKGGPPRSTAEPFPPSDIKLDTCVFLNQLSLSPCHVKSRKQGCLTSWQSFTSQGCLNFSDKSLRKIKGGISKKPPKS